MDHARAIRVFTSCLRCGLFEPSDFRVEMFGLSKDELMHLQDGFSVYDCSCYFERDRQKILGLMEAGAGAGIRGFNETIKIIVETLALRQSRRMSRFIMDKRESRESRSSSLASESSYAA